MSNRLKAYLDCYFRLPSSLALDNFRRALIDLYSHILKFLSHAIRIQQRSNTSRFARALWNHDDLVGFQGDCDRLCARAGEEARICGRGAKTQWREELTNTMISVREIHQFQATLIRLQDRADLARLPYAKEATYDSEPSRSLPGTRTEMLKQVTDWATDKTGKRIFWLCGKAGTGKSSISRSVAQKLDDDGLLGASFFFKRGQADRSHAKLLIPTIVRQLADIRPEISHAIAAALDQDSLLCERQLKSQFEKLLLQPLLSVERLSFPSAGIVLVIDALDECENSESIRTTLLLLSKIEAITSVRLRIFVTSRPELSVQLGFWNIPVDSHRDIQLEEAQESTISCDIRVFYEHRISEMREESRWRYDKLSAEWPGEDNMKTLVDQAVPLFIFASTICRYISQGNRRERLEMMLRESQDKPLTGLKWTYGPILDQVISPDLEDNTGEQLAAFKEIVGPIVLLSNPLSASALSQLLDIPLERIDRTLSSLHSVLNIPTSHDGRLNTLAAITLFHSSFRDFLVESEEKFCIKAAETHGILATHCIGLLTSGALKKDLCGTNTPGIRRTKVREPVVSASLPEAVAYACCYWTQHAVKSEERPTDNGIVFEFLQNHLLHYMEALSWLGKASDVVHHLEALRSIVDVCSNTVNIKMTKHLLANTGKPRRGVTSIFGRCKPLCTSQSVHHRSSATANVLLCTDFRSLPKHFAKDVR
jgi:hypothetical protein